MVRCEPLPIVLPLPRVSVSRKVLLPALVLPNKATVKSLRCSLFLSKELTKSFTLSSDNVLISNCICFNVVAN